MTGTTAATSREVPGEKASRGCVVLVEDDEGDALLVSEMLQDSAPGLRVETFPTLASAVEGWPPDVSCVLLDLGLPDSVGLNGLTRMREHVPNVPVVVLTGRIDDESGPLALAAGAQDFLVKGEVDAIILERSVRYAIERGRAQDFLTELRASELRGRENVRLERGLLPEPLLRTQDVRVSPTYRPGRERALLGGDFYDVVEAGDGRVHVLIGDVSGHGPDEAALGVAVRIAWRTLVLAGLEPQAVLQATEQVLLAERQDDERFATCAMLTFDRPLDSLTLRLAGHPAPALVAADRSVRVIDDVEPAPALTMVPGTPIEGSTHPIDGSWMVVLFTDGLVEGAASPGSATRWGADAMVEHLRELVGAGTSPRRLGPALVAEAERRQGGSLTDDVAVLVVGTPDWWES